jgi:D-tyrosyl-tRNA(Tyr) deacylase
MRAIVQRVSSASVEIAGNLKSEISNGLLVLVGIEDEDNSEDVEWLSNKIVNLRIFDDADGVMNLSLIEVGFQILVVSQFTLHAKIKKGNRPSYIKAARPEKAIPLYNEFNKKLERLTGKRTETGEFGANMQINLINNGPVTILFDTKNKE